jgi:hypothetical protein
VRRCSGVLASPRSGCGFDGGGVVGGKCGCLLFLFGEVMGSCLVCGVWLNGMDWVCSMDSRGGFIGPSFGHPSTSE